MKDTIETDLRELCNVSELVYGLSQDDEKIYTELKKIKDKELDDLIIKYKDNNNPLGALRFDIIKLIKDNKDLNGNTINELKNRLTGNYDKNVFHSWKNFNVCLPVILNKESVKITNTLSKTIDYIVSKLKFKDVDSNFKTFINDKQNFGSTVSWIAIYNNTHKKQDTAKQLFINIHNGQLLYGIYYHPADSYSIKKEQSASKINLDEIIDLFNDNISIIVNDNINTNSNKNITIKKKMETVSLNQILYGPPGTGKTYNTINKALDIIGLTDYETKEINNSKEQEKRIIQNRIFNTYKKNGQIEFVTFHQNYTYEDFVIGLKPDIENRELSFKQNYGVFYKISEKARLNYLKSKTNNSESNSIITFDNKFNLIFKDLIEDDTPIKIKMKSGKFMEVYNVSDTTIYFKKPNGSSQHTLSIKTLREYYTNIDRLVNNGLKPYYDAIVDTINYINVKTDVTTESLRNYVLIIDEINRANISRVFGELITLLEDDKRIGEINELIVSLPNGESFGVPPNLYIIGTMNTADKSIALIDIALRRRFEFEGKFPKPELIVDTEEWKESKKAQSLLKKINENIIKAGKTFDFTIGHAFFMKGIKITKVIESKIIPLLMEYFNNDRKKVTDIFNQSGYVIKYDDEKFEWNINESKES